MEVAGTKVLRAWGCAHEKTRNIALRLIYSRARGRPETKPTSVDGWVVREVANGTAVVQGPNGVWKAARGDIVPGLGRVDSVVQWGSRWIVSTSRGLITTQ